MCAAASGASIPRQVAIKVMDYYAPADGSAFELTAEKHSALLEVGGGVAECAWLSMAAV